MKSVDIFAGAGGLTLGIYRAGFQHQLAIEWNDRACQTLLQNQQYLLGEQMAVARCDVAQFDFSSITDDIALLAGGPPCQPFSHGGLHRSFQDKRDMFPQFIRAVGSLKPQAFLVENVKGLLRKSFAEYFQYLIWQLTYPEIPIRPSEHWNEHASRLRQYDRKGWRDGLFYNVTFRLLNAADYGVPQRRDRVFIIGIRSDLKQEWSFPQPTHSQEALLYSQWVTREYWEHFSIAPPEIPPQMVSQQRKLQSRLFPPDRVAAAQQHRERWLTVRDAIDNLPDPRQEEAKDIGNHKFVPGARQYPGHTGSPLDEPAKTLKAGVHGVPGGENMMRLTDGTVRYFTVREAARLQTFPDSYRFPVVWTEAMRQLGNAVPVTLSEILAKRIKITLSYARDISSPEDPR